MIRDRQHGPVVELNRIALRRSRATGKASVGVNATVFAQMANKLPLLTYDVLMLPHRTWKVKFVGMLHQDFLTPQKSFKNPSKILNSPSKSRNCSKNAPKNPL